MDIQIVIIHCKVWYLTCKCWQKK